MKAWSTSALRDSYTGTNVVVVVVVVVVDNESGVSAAGIWRPGTSYSTAMGRQRYRTLASHVERSSMSPTRGANFPSSGRPLKP